MQGSPELRTHYLDPADAGVPWLLDPDNQAVRAGIVAGLARRPGDRCDSEALVADLPDLLVLLCERHFGLATGVTAGRVGDPALGSWADTWRRRLATERPNTWGAALGTDLRDLRWLVGDQHLAAFGEDRAAMRAADPRAGELVLTGDSGPCVEWQTVGDVLCVRLRSLEDDATNERLLNQWQDGHAAHFDHDRIIVDVRGNAGGNDMHTYHWFADHVPAPVTVEVSRTWRLDGEPLNIWNTVVTIEASQGPDAVPQWLRAPYLLPRSGLLVLLGSKWNDCGDIEFVGYPVAVELDPATPLSAVAAEFDRFHPPRQLG